MNLKKCPKCNSYTLKEKHCSEKTKEAHYKFIKVKSAEIFESDKIKSN